MCIVGSLVDVISWVGYLLPFHPSFIICQLQRTFVERFAGSMIFPFVVLAATLAPIGVDVVNAQTTPASGSSAATSSEASADGTSATAPLSTYSESTVPTGTPLPGNYAGSLRPQVHYSPPVGFMNDPNGMFLDQDGLYHLYYQCKLCNGVTLRR
jgi:hypothetical protein